LIEISESFENKSKRSQRRTAFDDDQDDDLVKNLIKSSEALNAENVRKRKSNANEANEENKALTGGPSAQEDNDAAGDEKNLMSFLPGQSLAQRLLEKNKQRQLKQKKYRKEHDLKLAFSEFYLSLILLQNYQTLNFTGFRKILKKHDKIFKTDRGSDWYKTYGMLVF
jgi:hypothetical protein